MLVKMSGLSVVVVGDTECGKTQLINRFANGAFDQVSGNKMVDSFPLLSLSYKVFVCGHFGNNFVLSQLFEN